MAGTIIQKQVFRNGVASVDLGDPTNPGTLVPMADNDPLRSAYAAFLFGINPGASPTDVLTIQGSNSRIVRIRSLSFTGQSSAATNINISTVRRSAANTGGTFAGVPLVARDQNDAAATAVVNYYTAPPSGLGTAIGVADGGRLNLAPAANGSIDRLSLQYSWMNDKAPILRGSSDFLCVNVSNFPSGGLLDINVVLSEDANPSN